ncbi:MAG: hypothetical protein ACREP9_21980, partial [Candidatus Dormibacteraceae bacterium]
VLVTRPTELKALVAHHGTLSQARFFLESRGQNLEVLEQRDERFQQSMSALLQAIPGKWRQSRLDRSDLPSFLFGPEDIVIVLGQDGLVANVAKYLDGQPVIGLNPDPASIPGVLVRHPASATADLLADAASGRAEVEQRAMIQAALDDGQTLLALNEVFIGHCSHQSARYRLQWQLKEERQSSSGLIVSSGTGSTGWARSVGLERHTKLPLPLPTDPKAVFFVREAWPSPFTGTALTEGLIPIGQNLKVTSEMNEGGVLFGDGLELDHLSFPWGAEATLGIAPKTLHLIA